MMLTTVYHCRSKATWRAVRRIERVQALLREVFGWLARRLHESQKLPRRGRK